MDCRAGASVESLYKHLRPSMAQRLAQETCRPYTRMLSSSSRLTAPVGVRTLVASAIADPLVVLFPPGAIHDEIVRVSG